MSVNIKSVGPNSVGRHHLLKFDEERRAVFLDHLAKYDRPSQAAKLCGVSRQTVDNHLLSDPEFAQAYEEARGLYRDKIRQAIYEQAVEGISEPIMGGPYKDEIVAYRKIYAPNLLALEAKRVDQEYREKSQVDVNLKGGVLVIPPGMAPQDWAAAYASPKNDANEIPHEEVKELDVDTPPEE